MTLPGTDASFDPRQMSRTGDSPSARVLVAIAPDDHDNVLKIAWARAATRGVSLTLCTVVDSDHQRASVHELLTARVGTQLPADATVDFEVRVGDRAGQILASIAERETALLVIGETQQREGLLTRVFWPTASTRVVRGASCPILIARHTPGTGRVVAASALDEGLPVLQAAADEVKRAGGQVTALHCLEALTLVTAIDVPVTAVAPMADLVEAAAARLKQAMAEVGLDRAALRVEVASPAATILEVAKEIAADTIVVGTHGRTGPARLLLGSVAEAVVRNAPCNVLVVRIASGGEADSAP